MENLGLKRMGKTLAQLRIGAVGRWVRSSLLTVFVVGGGAVGLGFADPLATWSLKYPLGTVNEISAVAYGNGVFVLVGEAGRVMTSTDGVTWSRQDSGTDRGLNGITFGNGRFVAVGDYRGGGSVILTSTNGESWTQQQSPPSTLYAVAYGNGLFVAVGSRGDAVTSPDGVNWSWSNAGNVDYLFSVAFGNGVFVAVGGKIFTSQTGTNWVDRGSFGQGVSSVAFGNGRFVAGGWSAGGEEMSLVSTHGAAWTEYTGRPFASLRNVVWGKDRFVACRELFYGRSSVVSSLDGTHWVSQDPGTPARPLVYGNGMFLAADGDCIVRSTNGSDWIVSERGTPTVQDITYGGDQFVAVGGHGTILTSTNGETWIQPPVGTLYGLKSVVWGGGRFVAVGDTILTSTDAVSWSEIDRRVGTENTVQGLAYGGGRFVGVGIDTEEVGAFLTSADGLNWVHGSFNQPIPFMDVAYGNGLFVAVGYTPYWAGHGVAFTSPDGITWAECQLPVTNRVVDVCFGGGRFVAVAPRGEFDDPSNEGHILTSADGIHWFTGPQVTGAGRGVLVYGSGQFVAAGRYGGVMSSPDGVHWTAHEAMTRPVAYGDGHFVGFGEAPGIYSSGSIVSLLMTTNPHTPQVELSVTGPRGFPYTIEVSHDLASWQTLTHYTSTGSTSTISNFVPVGERLFYRAHQP